MNSGSLFKRGGGRDFSLGDNEWDNSAFLDNLKRRRLETSVDEFIEIEEGLYECRKCGGWVTSLDVAAEHRCLRKSESYTLQE